MFRYRRYRVFLVFAVFTVVALYRFGWSGITWREAASTAAELKNEAEDALGLGSKKPPPPIAHETKKLQLEIPAASNSRVLQTPPPVKQPPVPYRPSPAISTAGITNELQPKPSIPTPPIQVQPPAPASANQDALYSSIAQIHWTKLPEKFPVPPHSLIKLPTSKPRAIPKIQFQFQPEDDAAKANRLSRLEKIRDVFKKSWDGYKEFAWLHDELRPQSGAFKDPFANWGATLVDALDTLWIMGLTEEFEEAAKAVDEIDFTTTPRADIPMFETTIRYLGGLIAAYDISGKQYKNLLNKAVQLAEVLMGAFDTPNRMPELYYYWRPQFASQKHRASPRAVLAEIGSLSMEFTRLAQLTGEHKYYDAVARITDNLEAFQNHTKLPGMWPTYLDISGCGKVYIDMPPQEPLKPPNDLMDQITLPSSTQHLSPEGKEYIPLHKPDPIVLEPNGASPAYVHSKDNKEDPALGTAEKGAIRTWDGKTLQKRQLEADEVEPHNLEPNVENFVAAEASPVTATKSKSPECVPQGFVSTSDYGREEYTLGGMSDSTYEYLPKQFLLLGGQIEKYQTMYETSIEVIKKHLLFRPMLPDEDDVLFSGKLNVPSMENDHKAGDLIGENAHLTCFAGGMFGMAARIFNRPEDLEIAKKLTEGCVWSYNMTQSGIMPESFEVVPCDDTHQCTWNETLYWETLDPQSEYRLKSYEEQLGVYESQLASASSWYKAQLASMTATPDSPAKDAFPAIVTQEPNNMDALKKRQFETLAVDSKSTDVPLLAAEQDHGTPMGDNVATESEILSTPTLPMPIDDSSPLPSKVLPAFPYVYSPSVPLNHKEFVKNRIEEGRLPPGVSKIGSRAYILR